jgi:hypothetical protein
MTRLSRRAFLKLSAAAAAFVGALQPGLRLATSLPIPGPHHYFPDADELLARAARFDLVLVPAYVAAGLIRREAARPLSGPPGRAHDPAGAFTVPHQVAVLALVYRGRPPARPSLDHAFRPGALWPDYPRLAIAAALWRRGSSVNDTHPGHLARAGDDLGQARPSFVPDPLEALRRGNGDVALALLPEATLPSVPGARLPGEGRLRLEMDWLIPRASTRPEEAAAVCLPPSSPSGPRARRGETAFRLPPSSFSLSPLSASARRHYAEVWARLVEAHV